MAKALTLEILHRLIGFDTTSCNSNLELMAYVQDYLQQHGVASELVYDEAESKANLYATIGPKDKSGVMLSGHTDTVPVTGQNWTKQPYGHWAWGGQNPNQKKDRVSFTRDQGQRFFASRRAFHSRP